jgi:methionine-rich copper-binding protein CopC
VNRVIRLLAFTTASLFITTLSVAPSHSHSALVTSVPKADVILNLAPRNVTLTFNEDILELKGKQISSVSLATVAGRKIALTKPQISANKLIARITSPTLKSGKYQISYRVVSADGHVITGGYTFTVALTKGK